MFEAMRMLFTYVETPLHAGGGRELGAIDLPIQRERTTNYPIIQASSIKGCLRTYFQGVNGLSEEEHLAIFGPETGNAAEHAGALSVGDARILLFPVRSLAGVLAWTTSVNVLARFCRDICATGRVPDFKLPQEPGADQALVSSDKLIAGNRVVLEEFSFTPLREQAAEAKVHEIGKWLADNALPLGDEYEWWRDSLPEKLCILPEDAFRDFTQYATEVQTHIKLDQVTKTVSEGALWTTENIPADSLLYFPLMATRSRKQGVDLSADEVLGKLLGQNMRNARIRLGGNETTGQGVVAIRVFDPSGGDQK